MHYISKENGMKSLMHQGQRIHYFHLSNGSKTIAPFMTSREKQYVSAYDSFKVLRLPYKQGDDNKRRFSMYFYLPDAKDGLQALVEKLGSRPRFLDGHLPSRKVELDSFLIPKLKISFGFEASNTMKELGLVLPFCVGGLNEISDSQNLSVSSIYHKAFVEVNEQGTEAAAVTGVTLNVKNSASWRIIHSFLPSEKTLLGWGG